MCDNPTALLLYNNSSESPYGWDDTFWDDDILQTQNDPTNQQKTGNTQRCISYRILGSIIERLCPIFSEYICKAQGEINQFNTQPPNGDSFVLGMDVVVPKIAVSIPEGPYLVLAVLLVHTLACLCQEEHSSSSCSPFMHDSVQGLFGTNVTMSQPDDPSCESHDTPTDTRLHHAAPIIVPMDPNEGTERLGQMITDAKPCIILVASAYGDKAQPFDDWNKVCSAVDSLKSSSSDSSTSYRPLILSMKSLVKEALNPQQGSPFRHTFKLEDPPQALNRYLCCTKRQQIPFDQDGCNNIYVNNCVSHIVFTSGTTGRPKGCISSLYSLWNYVYAKNIAHSISTKRDVDQKASSFTPQVLLASALSFDPCLSDIIATYYAKATLVIASRNDILHHLNLVLQQSCTTHVLCTPSLWNTLTPLVYCRQEVKTQFPCLKVVALGGEPIPRRIVSLWAAAETSMSDGLKLLATYGVTEACVYQTAGEVFCPSVYKQPSRDDDIPGHSPGNDYQILIGQDVGTTFLGTKIRICKEPHDLSSTSLDINGSKLMDVDPSLKHECGLFGVGEVVLSGCQLDEYSSYLNLPQISSEKFVHVMTPCDVQTAAVIPDHSMMDCTSIDHSNQPNDATSDMLSPYQSVEYFYRTGDLACLDSSSGHLRILGRINGEEGLIKFNGIRIELGEIENAIQDPLVEDKSKRGYSVVERCVVVSRPKIDDDNQRHLWAYCILSTQVLHELGLTSSSFESSDSNVVRGILCTPSSPLLTLLRNRCRLRVRMGITPAKFIILSTIPMTPTGKCNYKALPDFFELLSNVSAQAHDSCNLTNYGRCGKALADEIISCLNIQSYHMSLMTTDASFAMLGGDSLAATRVVRGLYALHHGIANVRTLGGSYGTLEGPFNVTHLLSSANLGKYVDFLDKEGVLTTNNGYKIGSKDDVPLNDLTMPPFSENFTDMTIYQHENEIDSYDMIMYNALYEASVRNETMMSLALLNEGANPNTNEHGKRLGKTGGGRLKQKESFRSNALHIACLHGNTELVEALLNRGCNCKSPDANGQFPIHLACSGPSSTESLSQWSNASGKPDDLDRIECVRLLLAKGVPLTIRNSSKQTMLHCTARGGYTHLLKYILDLLSNDEKAYESLDWHDHWKRTAIHWAILNSNLLALQLLLQYGCNPNPPKHRVSKSGTSGAIESPLEMSVRIHGAESEFTILLENYSKRAIYL